MNDIGLLFPIIIVGVSAAVVVTGYIRIQQYTEYCSSTWYTNTTTIHASASMYYKDTLAVAKTSDS